MDTPAWLDKGRIPGLDGLRGLAILMVCLFHASFTAGWPSSLPLLLVVRQADLGVDLFLALSGFLITVLLVRSLRQGRLSLARFYGRRLLRIWPAYLAYLLVMALLHQAHIVRPEPTDWLSALTHTTNFLTNPHWVFTHLWSLAMEEQFYLLWPLLLLLCGRRRLLWCCLGLLALLPFVRWGIWLFNWNLFFDMGGRHPAVRLDALLLGCALGLAVFVPGFCRSATPSRAKALVLVLLAGGVALTSIPSGLVGWYPCVFGRLFYALAMAVLLWVAVSGTLPALSWLLNRRALTLLGTVSYSLYLWQQLFLFPHSPHWFMAWPVNILCALACSVLSYRLIEKPFLQLKERKMAEAAPSS